MEHQPEEAVASARARALIDGAEPTFAETLCLTDLANYGHTDHRGAARIVVSNLTRTQARAILARVAK